MLHIYNLRKVPFFSVNYIPLKICGDIYNSNFGNAFVDYETDLSSIIFSLQKFIFNTFVILLYIFEELYAIPNK